MDLALEGAEPLPAEPGAGGRAAGPGAAPSTALAVGESKFGSQVSGWRLGATGRGLGAKMEGPWPCAAAWLLLDGDASDRIDLGAGGGGSRPEVIRSSMILPAVAAGRQAGGSGTQHAMSSSLLGAALATSSRCLMPAHEQRSHRAPRLGLDQAPGTIMHSRPQRMQSGAVPHLPAPPCP